MVSCCPLGDALYEPRVVYESDNFFVAPTIGPMGIPGYFLIITKEHKEGMGSVSSELHAELRDVVKLTRSRISEKLGLPSLVFEHGPKVCGVRGGGCLDHAHFHVVPGGRLARPLAAKVIDYMGEIGNIAHLERIKGYDALRACHEQGRNSYMYIDTAETASPMELFFMVNFHTPSQFMRRIVAQQGNPSWWNWKTHPDRETMQRTLETFGSF